MPTFQFRKSTGRLTAYSFACGYRERRSTDRDGYGNEGLDTEIYHDGAVYHVRQHDLLADRKPTSVPSLLEVLPNSRGSSQRVQSTTWQVNRMIVEKMT